MNTHPAAAKYAKRLAAMISSELLDELQRATLAGNYGECMAVRQELHDRIHGNVPPHSR